MKLNRLQRRGEEMAGVETDGKERNAKKQTRKDAHALTFQVKL